MHAISHTTTPRCLSCPLPAQMCTLNSCKEFFFISAWFQPPLRKNPCRSNDRSNGEHGHTYARWTKGFSLEPGVVSRYYLVAEYRAVRTLSDMIGRCSSKLHHPDRQGPRIRKDEADIKSLIDMMENNWLNTLYLLDPLLWTVANADGFL